MSIRTAGEASEEATPSRRLVPMQVGKATVFVEDLGAAEIVEDEGIRTVGAVEPAEAFERGGDALQECVRIVGEKVDGLAETAKPREVTVEFSLNFEAKGKFVIPVLMSAESGVSTGIKVTAVWQLDSTPAGK
jgi:hypothetical protein